MPLGNVLFRKFYLPLILLLASSLHVTAQQPCPDITLESWWTCFVTPPPYPACDGFQFGQITTSTGCPLYPTDPISITSSGNWTCPIGRTCKWRYFRYLPSEWIEGATFSSSAPPANFQGIADCNGGFERVDVYFSEISPDPKTLAMHSVIWNPCSTPPPIVLKQPAEGSVLNYQCSTAISGKVYGTIPPNETEVTIDVDGQTTTAPLAGDGTFSTNSTILTGTHTAIASYSGGSDTSSFSSTCKSIEYESLPEEDDSRIIIHKYGSEAYSSPNQQTDGEIQVKLTVNVDLQPGSGQEVFFRIKDPDDPSPYETDNNQDDNFGGAIGRPAILGGAGVTNPSPGVWKASSDANGLITVTLQIPGSPNNPAGPDYNAAAGGDNYQLEASFDNFASNPNPQYVVASQIYTAWKRIYVETDEMFKRGAFVKGDATENAPGTTQLHVADKEQFKNCSKVRIIHAPYIDGSDNNFVFYSEDRDITNNRPSDGSAKGGFIQFVAGQVLANPYTKDFSAGAGNLEYIADAVGCIQGTNPIGTYHVSDELVEGIYKLAFVEFNTASQAHNLIPFRSPVTGYDTEITSIAYKWFQSSTRDPQPSNPFHQIALPNHQHVIYGSKNYVQTSLGTTIVLNDTNFSWIWYDNIKTRDGASNVDAVSKEILVHELAHQWKVNPSYTDGECTQNMSLPNNTNLFCTMNSGALGQNNNDAKNQRKDGIVGFHFVSKTDSEYMTIRWKQDPIPQP